MRIWTLLDPHFGEQMAVSCLRSEGLNEDPIRHNGSQDPAKGLNGSKRDERFQVQSVSSHGVFNC